MKETIDIEVIKESDDRLRDFKRCFYELEIIYAESRSFNFQDPKWTLFLNNRNEGLFEQFLILLSYTINYKYFIEESENIDFDDIRFTMNDVEIDVIKINDMSNFEVLMLIAENKLSFSSCNHIYVVGEFLDSVLSWIKDIGLEDVILEYFKSISHKNKFDNQIYHNISREFKRDLG